MDRLIDTRPDHQHFACIKKPNRGRSGAGYRQTAGTFPAKGPLSGKAGQVSWLAAWAYSLHLPKACASVVIADFVPLTVAGQRWRRTIFPGHGTSPRHDPTFVTYVIVGHGGVL